MREKGTVLISFLFAMTFGLLIFAAIVHMLSSVESAIFEGSVHFRARDIADYILNACILAKNGGPGTKVSLELPDTIFGKPYEVEITGDKLKLRIIGGETVIVRTPPMEIRCRLRSGLGDVYVVNEGRRISVVVEEGEKGFCYSCHTSVAQMSNYVGYKQARDLYTRFYSIGEGVHLKHRELKCSECHRGRPDKVSPDYAHDGLIRSPSCSRCH